MLRICTFMSPSCSEQPRGRQGEENMVSSEYVRDWVKQMPTVSLQISSTSPLISSVAVLSKQPSADSTQGKPRCLPSDLLCTFCSCLIASDVCSQMPTGTHLAVMCVPPRSMGELTVPPAATLGQTLTNRRLEPVNKLFLCSCL